MADPSRHLVAGALGTGLLVATLVGSRIMAQSLTTDAALALFANAIATGAALVVLIAALAVALRPHRTIESCGKPRPG